MYLALLLLVILVSVAGVLAFSINAKHAESEGGDETSGRDFEIIES